MRFLPTGLSALRLILALPAGLLLSARDYGAAFPVVFVAGITDYFDGFLARRFGWQSRTGAWLDPVADKVLMTTIFACLGWAGEIPMWFVGIVIGRDVMILAMAAFALAFTSFRDFPPSLWGKLSTNFQILMAFTQLVHLAGLVGGLKPILTATMALATLGTLISGVHYFYNGIRRLRSSWQGGD